LENDQRQSPWEFTRPDGQLDGYDIAIAKQLPADLGAKLRFVQTSGAGRIPALQTHKVDLVLAELDYTPLRAQTVAYTRASANPASQFIVMASSPYKTLDSLNDPNVIMGYALGGDEDRPRRNRENSQPCRLPELWQSRISRRSGPN